MTEGFKEIVLRPFIKDTDMDPTRPSNYRPVALLNVLMNVYQHIIKERLVTHLEKNKCISNMQAAYRKGRSTVDNILIVQEVFYQYRYKKGVTQKYEGKTGIVLRIHGPDEGV